MNKDREYILEIYCGTMPPFSKTLPLTHDNDNKAIGQAHKMLKEVMKEKELSYALLQCRYGSNFYDVACLINIEGNLATYYHLQYIQRTKP